MSTFDTDVVVVGAGPTGLMLAGELRLNGVSVVVLEKLAEPIRESRALGFSARTIEEFSQRGLLSRFGEVDVIPVGHFGGVPLDFRVLEGGSYGARGVPQARTEGVLGGWARELGAEVRRGVRVLALEQDADGVAVTGAAEGGAVTLRARHVVGADGARSAVRKLAGIDFPGTEPAVELRFADVAGVRLRPRFSGERVPGGMAMVLPLGPDRARLVYFDAARPLRAADGPIAFDEVVEAWRRLTGEDVSGATPLWVSSTTDASRQASQYRRGRVFLAGDAAHIHLPIGAQGMSAGVQDAVNLGWKLALDVKGQAPPGLLDTYQAERRPVGARILANTLAQRVLYLGGDDVAPLREVFAELVERHEPVRRHLAGMVTGLDIRHATVPGEHPLLGRRLPDGELIADGEKTSVFALLAAGRALLLELRDGLGLREAAAGFADRVDALRVDALRPDAAAPADAVLVRPDGYVAWVAPPGAGAGGLPDALSRWFGPAA
ncbi:FAD-dependent monooxygenase [Streptomyces sp. NPDC046985]|uniref:FAD-dependent monooxygenase n=1 Tax=Streptomyces sp. NPDC046985 TaxID=3155377 RepID=UPI0033ECE8C5